MSYSSSRKPNMVLLLGIIFAFTACTAAQSLCDPLTEYDSSGQCCRKCPPGTKMASNECKNPVCEKCDEDGYQDAYHQETKCKLQPYCDPNKNLEDSGPVDEKTKNICVCKPGFHCSSAACITCVAHTPCPTGHGVVSKGNMTQDTRCQKCPDGTFSNETSSHAACLKWTECGEGYEVEQKGTDESDTICAKNTRTHTIVTIVLVLVVMVAVLGGLFHWKNKQVCMKKTLKQGVECLGPETKPLEETDESIKTPVENDDCHGVSENGNFVTQELGKGEILSRQESQMETLCEIVSS